MRSTSSTSPIYNVVAACLPLVTIRACVTLRAEPDYGTGQPAPAFMPWTQVADIWLQRAGFMPGQRMRFAFDYRNRCLTISPDRG